MRIQPKRQTRENEAKTAYVLVSAGFCRMTTRLPGIDRIRQERILRAIRETRRRGYEGELSAAIAQQLGECEVAIDEVMAHALEARERQEVTARVQLKGTLDEMARTYRDTMDELAEAREVA